MNRNKAKGMLWGLVVGDAFGSPIQFTGKDNHPWITEMVACPVFKLPPGYWTVKTWEKVDSLIEGFLDAVECRSAGDKGRGGVR